MDLDNNNHSLLLVLFGGAPNTEISKFINAYKSASRIIKKEYPNIRKQLWKEYLAKTFGSARFIYNKILGDKIDYYKKTGEMLKNTPAQYKKEFEWLKEVDSLALANVQQNLERAYKSFFRDKSIGFPKFKTKKTNYLSKTPTNKYFISILVDTENKALPMVNKKIGIDVGLKEFAICSDGYRVENPKYLRKSEKRLTKLQRELSRKQKGSKNRYKARLKVAKLYEKITNQRKDFLHKLSTKLIRENQSIAIENLKIKNMLKNDRLYKAISEVSWYEFRTMLEYKAEWYGRTIVVAPTNYASSQLCSCCGYKNTDVKNLALRNWTCLNCGANHDRDINASKNLEKLIA